MNASVTDKNTATTRRMVRKAIGYAPGSSLLPDSASDGLEEWVMGFFESNPDVSRTLKDGYGAFDSFVNSLQDFVLGICSPKSLNTRNAMLTEIGVTSKGQPAGDNPFTSIDSKLGIQVSDQIQALCEGKIRDLTGWFGMNGKGAAKTVLAMQAPIEKIIFNGLREKYGTKQNDEQLQTRATAEAKLALGIDDATLNNSDPAYWLARTPPATGIAGMIMGSATTNNGTAVALNLNSATTDQAAAGKDDKAQKQADALKDKQKLAVANQATPPPAPAAGPGSTAPKPAPAPRVGGP